MLTFTLTEYAEPYPQTPTVVPTLPLPLPLTRWDNDLTDASITQKGRNSAEGMVGGVVPTKTKQLATAGAGSATKTLSRDPDVAWKASGFVDVPDQFPKSDPDSPMPKWKEVYSPDLWPNPGPNPGPYPNPNPTPNLTPNSI